MTLLWGPGGGGGGCNPKNTIPSFSRVGVGFLLLSFIVF